MSSVTGGRFLIPDGDFTCKTDMVIYLITCSTCAMQYVGKTKNALHTRMNSHRSSVKNNNKARYFYDHYNKAGHSFRDADIRIIDYVEGGDEQMLGDKEDFWIDTLCTAYPLGLNDNIRGEGNISRSNLDQVYFRSPVLRWKRSHGRKKKVGGRRVVSREDRCKERMEREIVELKGLLDRSKKEFYRKLKSYSRRFLILLSREAGGRIGFKVIFRGQTWIRSILGHQC